jgi:uncharacterized protein involved in propanediol utilization
MRNKLPGSLFNDASKVSLAKKAIGSKSLIGYGKSFASFGEIVQGRTMDDQDFLITLPIDLWSTCIVTCTQINGPLIIECEYEKSRALLYKIMEAFEVREGFHIECLFTRNIPVGKGLSSSTADMLAALRALQEIFGVLLSKQYISKIFNEIEPHDGVHYDECVAYNHRKGILIRGYGHIPKWKIIAIDNGGDVDTVEFNKNIFFNQEHKKKYDELLFEISNGFDQKNDLLIAKCATDATKLYFERTGLEFVNAVIQSMQLFGAIGVVVTHSGTCCGLIYPETCKLEKLLDIAGQVKSRLALECFIVETIRLIN